jgi:hypothetical protein
VPFCLSPPRKRVRTHIHGPPPRTRASLIPDGRCLRLFFQANLHVFLIVVVPPSPSRLRFQTRRCARFVCCFSSPPVDDPFTMVIAAALLPPLLGKHAISLCPTPVVYSNWSLANTFSDTTFVLLGIIV